MNIVLLSGGLRSTALLHHTLDNHHRPSVHAVVFSYAHPARDTEVYAAQTIAKRAGVPCTTIFLPDLPKSSQSSSPPILGLYDLLYTRTMVEFGHRIERHSRLFFGFTKTQSDFDYIAAGHVLCPFRYTRLADVVLRSSLNARHDFMYASSCVYGRRCGQCYKCVARQEAFTAVGVRDPGLPPPPPHGGDPHRDAALRT